MLEKIGGRKFIIVTLTVILLFVLVASGKLEAKEYLTFLPIFLAEYITGNIASRITQKKEN